MSGAGEILLPLPSPIDLALTVASHGWAHLEPWRWDPEAGVLARHERIDGRLGTVAVAQRDLGARHSLGRFHADGPQRNKGPGVALAVGRLGTVGGDCDPRRRRGADWARRWPLLRCSTFYEDFVKTVLTINTSWSSTCRMAAALVAEPGDGSFPGPEAVLDYGEQRLRERADSAFARQR